MRVEPAEIARLKDQIPLSDLVGRDVAWDKKKSNPRKRDFWGCCPFHGEKSPSFHVDDAKGFYHCFGCGVSGDHIRWLTDFRHLTFQEAIRELGGEEVEATEEALQQRQRDRERAQERKEDRQRQEDRQRARKAQTAVGIWESCRPIAGTLAEKYLRGRGIDVPPSGWPDVIGFHTGLEWELGSVWEKVGDEDRKVSPGPIFPALVGRVQDISGDTTAVWRIFIDPATAKKAPVDNPKLGLGPATGGAVRIGGIGPVIGGAEGLETALGAWSLVKFKYPVWSLLSTAGVSEFEPPMAIKKIMGFPDGDKPLMKDRSGEYIPAEAGAGMRAQLKLKARCAEMGVEFSMQPEPAMNTDYLDIWNTVRGMGFNGDEA